MIRPSVDVPGKIAEQARDVAEARQGGRLPQPEADLAIDLERLLKQRARLVVFAQVLRDVAEAAERASQAH